MSSASCPGGRIRGRSRPRDSDANQPDPWWYESGTRVHHTGAARRGAAQGHDGRLRRRRGLLREHRPATGRPGRRRRAPTSRDRPPLGDQARRMGGQTGSTRRCGPPATAYPARRGCWHHGARWISWTASGCRRTVGWCSLFGGRTTSPRPTARVQRRETRTSRPRPADMSINVACHCRMVSP